MKKSSTLLIAAVLILSSCGSVAQIASSDNGQKFQDGIYSNTPTFRTRVEKEQSDSETQALVEKTKESPIYLFGDKKDTVMIPDNMSATIRFDQKMGGTVVTVGENPYDWRYDLENNYGYYYGPYSIGSSWYWSRHYYPWHTWAYSPSWRYFGWYDPWYYGFGGWYDPWYYGSFWGGWYDPWYYGGYWGTWYHPHYAGWYGGWDPYWGHHHHGPGYWHDRPDQHRDVYYGSRHQTGSDKVFGNGTSLRGGLGTRSSVGRNSTVASSTSTRSDRGTSGTSSVVRTRPSSRNEAAAPSRVSATAGTRRPTSTVSGNSGPSSSRPTGTAGRTSVQTNHRRPATATGGTVNRGDSRPSNSGAINRGTTSINRSSAAGNQMQERNSSSYNRSSSSSAGRSGMSTGGGSRSSYSGGGGGGGYSRSGGSTGGGRR